MRKIFFIFLTTALLGSTASFASCTANDDNAASQYEQATFIPQAPDYNDAAMWVTADGDTSRPLIIAGFSQGGLAARNMLPTKASSMWATSTAASLGYTASVWRRTSKSVHATIIVHQRNSFTRSGEQVTSILL